MITGAGQQWGHFYRLNRNMHTWINIWKYCTNVSNHLIQRGLVEGNPDLWKQTSTLSVLFSKKDLTLAIQFFTDPSALRRCLGVLFKQLMNRCSGKIGREKFGFWYTLGCLDAPNRKYFCRFADLKHDSNMKDTNWTVWGSWVYAEKQQPRVRTTGAQ